ncbi:MAG: YHS domain-containing protein [Spirochaetes bacterium]|nr:MAG: YHS domain-containing protein [Spirochaetota bacterium]
MKRFQITTLTLALCMTFAFAACGESEHHEHKHGSSKAQTECPVLGGAIDKSLYADYKGERIYFCCKGCPEEFSKNPEKYMKKLRDQGVELEKSPAPVKK